ncbi:MAG: phosphoribosylanthranilate isomerase [Solirubrobacteraceae bacterium]
MGLFPYVPKIKFCGITSLPDAECAAEAGAWAIGLILWPSSPRRCEPEVAARIAAALRRRVEVVGVFVNPRLDELARTADAVGLTMLQLHGDEGPVFCAEARRRTGCAVIKAARVRSRADIQALSVFHVDYHLLDSHAPGLWGGTGETFAWELARGHSLARGPSGKLPVLLSGGLTPANVAEAIAATRPFAVDVASGVELAPGRKDRAKLEAFAQAVQSTAPGTPDPTAPSAPDPAMLVPPATSLPR